MKVWQNCSNQPVKSVSFCRLYFLNSLLAMASLVQSAHAGVVPAKSADAFVDSIGVNTHLAYTGSAYHLNWTAVRSELGALGVRHIRDSTSYATPTSMARLKDLADTFGIHSLIIVDCRTAGQVNTGTLDSSLIAGQLALIKANFADATEAIGGPNEYDLNSGGDAAWVTTLRLYQQALYSQVKADGTLSSKTVVSPAIATPLNLPSIGDMSGMVEAGDTHPYPNGAKPSSRTPFDTYTRFSQDTFPGRPLWVSESGYHNALSAAVGQHPVTEAAASNYIPRMFLHYFRRGIKRTYSYDFIDDHANPGLTNAEDHFGLLRNDATEKPAYTALKNWITLLKEPGASFTPGYLNYSLNGSTANLHDLLLQKSDGTFYLALWLETTATTSQSVTLGFNQTVNQAVTYAPNTSTNPVATYTSPTSLALTVTDTPMLVRVSPAASASTLVFDDLANFSQVISVYGWQAVTPANTNLWLGDGTRICRSADNLSNYIYWAAGVQSFNGFTVYLGYAGSSFDTTPVYLYTSADASTWSAPMVLTRGITDGTMQENIFGSQERYITCLSPAGPLPAGTKYVKIKVGVTGSATLPQITKMYLSKQ